MGAITSSIWSFRNPTQPAIVCEGAEFQKLVPSPWGRRNLDNFKVPKNIIFEGQTGKSRNSCRLSGWSVGAEGMVKRGVQPRLSHALWDIFENITLWFTIQPYAWLNMIQFTFRTCFLSIVLWGVISVRAYGTCEIPAVVPEISKVLRVHCLCQATGPYRNYWAETDTQMKWILILYQIKMNGRKIGHHVSNPNLMYFIFNMFRSILNIVTL